MADWLDDLITRARRRDPIPCAGCGKPYDRADMLEATLPSLFVPASPRVPRRPGRVLAGVGRAVLCGAGEPVAAGRPGAGS
jgi:hypothetical protein